MPDSPAASSSPLTYVCIDVEASGPIPDPFNLVSIGAVPVSQLAGGTWRVNESALFYVELRPLYQGFDPTAMAIHGITREHLEEHGTEPGRAMENLAAWALRHSGAPVFVGHNAVFDWAYINHYFVRLQVRNPFGWKALDTKSMAAGTLGLPFPATSKENLSVLLPGLEVEDLEHKHRADYDALYQARILKALLEHPRPRT